MDSHIDLSQPNITKIKISKKNDEIPFTKQIEESDKTVQHTVTEQAVCPPVVKDMPVTVDIPRRNSLEPVQLRMSMLVISEVI